MSDNKMLCNSHVRSPTSFHVYIDDGCGEYMFDVGGTSYNLNWLPRFCSHKLIRTLTSM